jgi:hypothetical protein
MENNLKVNELIKKILIPMVLVFLFMCPFLNVNAEEEITSIKFTDNNGNEVNANYSSGDNTYSLLTETDAKEVTVEVETSDEYTVLSKPDTIKLNTVSTENNNIILIENSTGIISVYSVTQDKTKYDFTYTGSAEAWTVPATGTYTLELWGAEGGNRDGKASGGSGGRGGYSKADVFLTVGQVLYINVGGNGTTHNGYNGGGTLANIDCDSDGNNCNTIYGGGATDIRLTDDDLTTDTDDETSLASRIIVAGGGGSVGSKDSLGAACGNTALGCGTGGNTATYTSGGTVSDETSDANGKFGIGGNGSTENYGVSGAGGGGWYGGGGALTDLSYDDDKGGGGGSNFAYTEKGSAYLPDGTTNPLGDNYLTNDVLLNGDETFKDANGHDEIGNLGDGYVRITAKGFTGVVVDEDDTTDTTKNVWFTYNKSDGSSEKVLFDEFDVDQKRYTVTVDDDVTSVNVEFNIDNSQYTITCSSPVKGNCSAAVDLSKQNSGEYYATIENTALPSLGIKTYYIITFRKTVDYLSKNSSDGTSSYNYEYTGGVQKFIVPATGTYKLETWGATGGNRGGTGLGGNGGYASGEVELTQGEVLYLYVGGNGTTHKGYNGGGHLTGTPCDSDGFNCATTVDIYGGGATDIRYEQNTLYNRILVAGGGGSVGAVDSTGGSCGNSAAGCGTGGEKATYSKDENSIDLFGQGEDGLYANYGYAGAGGGGWYGGHGSIPDLSYDDDKGGGGGSNFAYTTKSVQYLPDDYVTTINDTTAVPMLTNDVLKKGDETYTLPDGTTNNTTGNNSLTDGYIRITPISFDGVEEVDFYYDNSSTPIIYSNFRYDKKEYTVEIEDSIKNIAVDFKLKSGYSIVSCSLGSSCKTSVNITSKNKYTYTIKIQNNTTGATTDYSISFHKQSDHYNSSNNSYEYQYTGIYETFTAPTSGTYTLQTWGASGGGTTGGKGGYASGDIFLNAGQKLYINVGGNGNTRNGYNGSEDNSSDNSASGGKVSGLVCDSDGFNCKQLTLYGGGSTDIRYNDDNFDINSINTRILVAGGGGSDSFDSTGLTVSSGGAAGRDGSGDSDVGKAGVYSATDGYTFGKGQSTDTDTYGFNGAGGGGWYGGTSGTNTTTVAGGGGGSYFAYTSSASKYIPDGYLSLDQYTLLTNDTEIKGDDPDNEMPVSGAYTEGNGYIRITPKEFVGANGVTITNTDTNEDIPINFNAKQKDYTITLEDVKNVKVDFQVATDYIKEITLNGTKCTSNCENISLANISKYVYTVKVINTKVSTDEDTYTITFRNTNSHLDPTSGDYNYEYSGGVEVFTAPADGLYTVETWGATGGDRGGTASGGKGGFVSAEVKLKAGEQLYIYVGGSGNSGGFNGGGEVHKYDCDSDGFNCIDETITYGGGATDIRYGDDSLYNRILVAGGGGSVGGADANDGGAGGSDAAGCGVGGTAGTLSSGGTSGQDDTTTNGSFGVGGNGTYANYGLAGAGGGGWYGGGGATPDLSYDDDKGGGGGSNFAFTENYSACATLVEDSTGTPYALTSDNYLDADSVIIYKGDDENIPEIPVDTNGNGYVKITTKTSSGVTKATINYKNSDGGDETTLKDFNNANNGKGEFDFTQKDYYFTVSDSLIKVNPIFLLENGYTQSSTSCGYKVGDTTCNSSYNFSDSDVTKYVYTITVTGGIRGVEIYTFTFRKQSDYVSANKDAYDFEYTGHYEKFIVPSTGTYTLETWGAQGGTNATTAEGGLGGYSKADMYLEKGEVLYINVGGNGTTNNGYNGGGQTTHYACTEGTDSNATYNVYGGGASDIRYNVTDVNDSLNNRILVAGGGGAVLQDAADYYAGAAGAASKTSAAGVKKASDSTDDTLFGAGGNSSNSGPGGGGWYGGQSGTNGYGGAGGSGFAYTEGRKDYVPTTYVGTGQIGYYLTNAEVLNGTDTFTDPDGSIVTGHSGDGYVRITPKKLDGVKSVTIKENDKVVDFTYDYFAYDYDKTDYTISLDDDIDTLSVEFDLKDNYSKAGIRNNENPGCTGNTCNSNFSAGNKNTYVLTITNNEIYPLVNNPAYERTYTITFTKTSAHIVKDEVTGDTYYDYPYTTGDYEKFIAPTSGTYTLETWGAEGGYQTGQESSSGKGGYSKANIYLTKGEELYIFTGGSGNNGGYNGGAVTSDGYYDEDGDYHETYRTYSGGASDIRYGLMKWHTIKYIYSTTGCYQEESDVPIVTDSLENRILVAGGGGSVGSGNTAAGNGGYPGGSVYGALGGTTTSGGTNSSNTKTDSNGNNLGNGTFGSGGEGYNQNTKNGWYSGAGGSGWYGGSSGTSSGSGAGGSSYALVDASSLPSTSSYTPSKFVTDAEFATISGNTISATKAPNGTTETGHTGDGYVRITLSEYYDYEITADSYITITPTDFDVNTQDYTGVLSSDAYSKVNFDVSTSNLIDTIMIKDADGSSAFTNNKVTRDIHVGENKYYITVNYVTGGSNAFTYTINRQANSIDTLEDINLISNYDPKTYPESSISNYAVDSNNNSVTFDKDTLTYTINLPVGFGEFDIKPIKGSADQYIEIDGTDISTTGGKITVKDNSATFTKTITVYSETDTTHSNGKTYTLNFKIPHSSLIKNLSFTTANNSNIKIPLDNITITNNQVEFNIDIDSYVAAIYLPEDNIDLYDSEATYKVDGVGHISKDKFDVTITVTEPNVDPTTYVIHFTRTDDVSFEEEADPDGGYKVVTVPYDHNYFLQVWGAQGGSSGGHGGYSYGTVYLKKGTTLYLYSGLSGDNGGYNGGGYSNANYGFGGGASDIRIGDNSVYARVIVAGGGGGNGYSDCAYGGVGGGLSGGGGKQYGTCGTNGFGGTQTSGGNYGFVGNTLGASAVGTSSFGKGANAVSTGVYFGGAGGGGWYGGGSGANSSSYLVKTSGGGGGSGFVYTAENTTTADTINGWLLYTPEGDYHLTDAKTLSGDERFESPTGDEEDGHTGNGTARISIPKQESENYFLKAIITNSKNDLTPKWDYDTFDYYITLNEDETELNIEGIPENEEATVIGNGDYTIPAGTTTIPLYVTAPDGTTQKVYNVHITRQASSDATPKDIKVNGFMDKFCSNSGIAGACEYSFDVNTHDYEIVVPYSIRELVMVVDKAHPNQTVEITMDGETTPLDTNTIVLNNEITEYTVKVISEDGKDFTIWNYKVTRDMTGNNDLKSLEIAQPVQVPIFDYSYNVTEYYETDYYQISVPSTASEILINAVPDDSNATVSIAQDSTVTDTPKNAGYQVLKKGQNKIQITVTPACKATSTSIYCEPKTYTLYVTRLDNDNAYLENLTITNTTDPSNEKNITYSPSFNYLVNNYTATVDNDVDEIRIDGTFSTAATPASISEVHKLQIGANKFTYQAKSEDGYDGPVYTIIITRLANSNAYLKTFTFDELTYTPAFDKETFRYYASVKSDVTKLTPTVIPEESTSTVELCSGSDDPDNLKAGLNVIKYCVQPEEKSISPNVYELYVTRTASTEDKLLTLTVTKDSDSYALTPKFNPNTNTYNITLDSEVSEIILTATTDYNKRATIQEASNSTVYSEKIDLVANNGISRTFTVQAEDTSIPNNVYYITINRTLSKDNTLSSLTLTDTNDGSNIPFDQTFNPQTDTYTVTVPNNITKVKLDAITNSLLANFVDKNNNYSKSYSETIDLRANNNSVTRTITVKAEDSTVQDKTYTVTINRTVSTDSTIKTLTISDINGNYYQLDQTFNPSTLSYTVTVPNNVTTAVIDAETTNEFATFTSNNQTTYQERVDMITNGNVVTKTIQVTAEDGTTSTYTVQITREISNDSTLSTLILKDDYSKEAISLSPDFAPNITSYTLALPNDISDINIEAIATNQFAKISSSGSDTYSGIIDVIKNGNNFKYTIQVTAEDGTTSTTYEINITRPTSSENRIKSLEIPNTTLNPDFYSNLNNYTITTYEDVLTLNYELMNRFATVKCDVDGVACTNNQAPLKVGTNIITLSVTAEDGTGPNDYVITVTKSNDTDNYLSSLSTSQGLTPSFIQTGENYTVTTESEDITINATKASKYAKDFKITDSSGNTLATSTTNNIEYTTKLSLGTETFYVEITAQDGNTRKYEIVVNRTLNQDSSLKDLTTSEGINEKFDSTVLEYSRETYSSEITIIPTLNNSKSHYEIYDSEGNKLESNKVELKASDGSTDDEDADHLKKYNVFTIKVISEAGNPYITDYKLTITRVRSNVATIDTFGFDVNETYDKNNGGPYSVTIDDDAALDFSNLKTTDPLATTAITGNTCTSSPTGCYTLDTPTTVTILVTAPSGLATMTYTINVTRVTGEDSRLKSIALDNYDLIPEFDKDTNNYEVHIQDSQTSATLDISTLKNMANITSIDVDGTEVLTANSNIFNDIITVNPQSKNGTLITIKTLAEDGIHESTYTLRVLSENKFNNYLKDLKASCGTLDPTFNKDTDTYTVYTTSTDNSCIITATKEVTNATVTGDGNYSFPTTDKYLTAKVNVTSENNETRTYTINIRRPISHESEIDTLSINNGTFTSPTSWGSSNYNYYVEVPEFMTTISASDFTYTPVDPDTKVTFQDPTALIKEQSVDYVITTEAECGESTHTTTYTFHITRVKSIDTTIKSITVTANGESNTCTMLNNSCMVDIPSEATNYRLVATLASGAKITQVTSSNNNSGTIVSTNTYDSTLPIASYNDTLLITDEAEDNNYTDTYSVIISRKLSSDNLITGIDVNNIPISNFKSSDENPKTSVIGTISQVLLNVTLSSSKAKVVSPDLSKPITLNYGTNTISITVEAEDGTEKVYNLTIERCDSDDATLSNLEVDGYSLNTTFIPSHTVYYIRMPRNSTVLNASDVKYTINHEHATAIADKDVAINFNQSTNTYTITVTAGDGVTTNKYIISILPILSVNTGVDHVEFGSDKVYATTNDEFEYGIFTDETDATLTDIVLSDSLSQLNATLPQTIPAGSQYQFTVTAEDGTVSTYVVKVEINKTKELDLANIETIFTTDDNCTGNICTLTPQFSSTTYDYSITVPYKVRELNLNITQKDKYQQVTITGNSDFQVGSNNKVTITVTNSLGQTRDYTINVTREPSTEAKLNGIIFAQPDYTVDNFNEDTHTYNVEFNGLSTGAFKFDYDKMKKDPGQTISYTISNSGDGDALYFGLNVITLTVQSESCTSSVPSSVGCNTETYIVNVYRNDKYSNLLQSLTVSSGNVGDLLAAYPIVFNPYKEDYVLPVESEVTKVKIGAIAKDQEHATVEIFADGETTASTTGEFNLKLGDNKYQIVVTPENAGEGDIHPKTYTLTIRRYNNSNVNLESLSVDGYEFTQEYDKTSIEYELKDTVESSVDSLHVNAIPEEDDEQVYIYGDSGFESGRNVISVVVFSADGTRGKTYRIYFDREKNNNKYLNNIHVTDTDGTEYTLKPTFSNDNNPTNEYSTTVPKNINLVNVTFDKGHTSQIVTGEGKYALDYGENKIPDIIVTAEDGTTNTYYLTINREYELNLSELKVTYDGTTTELLTSISDGDIYNMTVPSTVNSVDIDAKLVEELDTLTGTGKDIAIKAGLNKLEVVVSYKDKKSKTYTIYITKEASKDNTLSMLDVDEGVLSPVFDKDTEEYTVDIPYEYDKVTVNYTTTDKNATVEISDTKNIIVGTPKVVTVKVKSESGDTKTYKITVNRLAKSQADNHLLAMYLDEAPLTPTFTQNTISYYSEVSTNINNVTLHVNATSTATITVTKENSTTQYTLNSTGTDQSTSLDLTDGDNKFIIDVVSQDGVSRKYKLNVYRSGPSEARIAKLSFIEASLNEVFDKDTYNYTMNVSNSTTALTVKDLEMVKTDATYQINSVITDLQTGDNDVVITTTSPDGKSHKTYTIKVTRDQSSNAYLSNILLSPEYELKPEFDKDTYNYEIIADNDLNSILVHGIPEDSNATITGNDVYYLSGSEYEIILKVTSEDKSTERQYKITVKRNLDDNNDLFNLYINPGNETLTPSFDPAITEYTAEVDNYIDQVYLGAILSSSKATLAAYDKDNKIGVGYHELRVGENKLTIKVMSESEKTKEYHITITRKSEYDDTMLEDLRVKEGELLPKFSPKTLTGYSVTIPYDYDSVNFIYTPHNKDATVSITGDTNLSVGTNKAYITVSYNGSSKQYEVEIIRQTQDNTYLSNLSVSNFDITPAFTKTSSYYTLQVGSAVESIDIYATPEVSTNEVYIKNSTTSSTYSILSNNLQKVGLNLGLNTIYIKVINPTTGSERVYTIDVTKKNSDENKLLTFTTDLDGNGASYDKPFSENDYGPYTITVPVNTNSITLSGTYSANATQTGLQTYNLTPGTTTAQVVITSQSGIASTPYVFKIVRPADTDSSIKDITVSSPVTDVLTPAYNQSLNTYDYTVEGDISTISFKVDTNSPTAKVTGNTNQLLNPGIKNKITIRVTAESGGTDYTDVVVWVYRKVDIQSFTTDNETYNVGLGGNEQIKTTFTPSNIDTSYQGLTYTVKDTDIISVDANGLITGLKTGTTTVTITSTRNTALTKTVTVNVIPQQMTSKVPQFIINRDTDGYHYVTGMERGLSIADFLYNFSDQPQNLKVYDKDGNPVSTTDTVKTKLKVKLEINGTVYDELWICLKGDVNGDGLINASDPTISKKSLTKSVILDPVEKAALDVTSDGSTNAGDITLMKKYLTKKVTSINDALYKKYGVTPVDLTPAPTTTN